MSSNDGLLKDEYYLLKVYKYFKQHYKFFIGLIIGLVIGILL